MSRSIHITKRNFAQLSKREINEQFEDPHSDLAQWAKKSQIKKNIRAFRKDKKQIRRDDSKADLR